MPDPGSGAGDNQPDHSVELAWQRIKIMGWYTADRKEHDDNPYLTYTQEGWRNPVGLNDHHKYIGEGVGRNYPRRMGVRWYHKWNGSSYDAGVTASNNEVTKIIDDIQIDDRIEFHIHPATEKLDKYVYTEESGIRIDDINSEIDSQRMAADDALQIGEIFQIGRTVWRVYERN